MRSCTTECNVTRARHAQAQLNTVLSLTRPSLVGSISKFVVSRYLMQLNRLNFKHVISSRRRSQLLEFLALPQTLQKPMVPHGFSHRP